MALEHGVSESVIAALRVGEAPVFERDDEQVVFAVANQLLNDRRVSDEVYAEAERLFGEAGMVELVALVGYYCLISMLLNLFAVPLPAGEAPSWPGG